MVHDSMRNLELDKRLARRRGWIEPERLRQALETLPDVSEKVARPEEGAETAASPGEAPGTPGA
jgi:hypothetical protein